MSPNTIAGTHALIRIKFLETGSNPLNCTTAVAIVVIAETLMIASVKIVVFNDENVDGFCTSRRDHYS
jgi:hypothetical protein